MAAEINAGGRRWWRQPAWGLALLLLLSHAYFYGGAWSNQNARFDAIFTCVEPGPQHGTLRIDPFLVIPAQGAPRENSEDWSLAPDGHYYANKAPGAQLLGVPVYWLCYHGEPAFGLDPLADWLVYLNAYLINLCVTVLPLALAVPLAYSLLVQLTGGAAVRAFWLTVVLLWGTMVFPFSTQLWGHVTAVAAVILLLYGLARDDRRGLALAGLGGGLAVLADYYGGVLVLVTGAVLVVRLAAPARGDVATRRCARRQRLTGLLAFGSGGLLPLVVHVLYHRLCFGLWLASALTYENRTFVQADKAMGVFGSFSLAALDGLTLSPERGLFYTAPVLLLALPGWWYWWQAGERRTLWAVTLGGALATLLLTACFNGWQGGMTFGPRYLIVALPMWVLPLAWLPLRALWQGLLAALGVWSAAVMLIFTSVSPLAGDDVPNPLAAYCPKFLAGDLAFPHHLRLRLLDQFSPEVARYGAFNLGQLAGLPGLLSLLPWALLMALALWWLHRQFQRPSGR